MSLGESGVRVPEMVEQQRETAGSVVEQALHRRRWLILGLLFSITVVNFIDRQTLSVLAPVIRSIFHLTNVEYGRIVAALQFGMMSGEFPMGYLMDRWGTRLGISLAVAWWSSATAAQVFARSGTQFGLIRYWMGTGECGNFSGGVKTATRLFAPSERTLAIGIFNSGSMVGATIAPPLIVYLLHRFGFRAAFLVPSALGVIWVIVWWFVYQREVVPPRDVRQRKISLRELLSDSSAWAVMMCRFFVGPVIQFYWYWIPSYLYSVRHMSLMEVGFVSWIPFLMGDGGNIFGGWAAGVMLRRGVPVASTRRWLMFGSSAFCFASMLVPLARGSGLALALIGIAVCAHNFLSANMYGAITDLFPDSKVGRATGLTGVAGGLSGLLFPLLTGILVDRFSYRPVFVLIAIMPLVGTFALFVLGRKYRTMSVAYSAT
jgi:ACS family hexuronate transporter-like MFS transporter